MAIDASRYIDKLENDLRTGDETSRFEALAILRRWSHDATLEPHCQRRARELVREFGNGI